MPVELTEKQKQVAKAAYESEWIARGGRGLLQLGWIYVYAACAAVLSSEPAGEMDIEKAIVAYCEGSKNLPSKAKCKAGLLAALPFLQQRTSAETQEEMNMVIGQCIHGDSIAVCQICRPSHPPMAFPIDKTDEYDSRPSPVAAEAPSAAKTRFFSGPKAGEKNWATSDPEGHRQAYADACADIAQPRPTQQDDAALVERDVILQSAIAIRNSTNPTVQCWLDIDDETQEDYKSMARAALAVVRKHYDQKRDDPQQWSWDEISNAILECWDGSEELEEWLKLLRARLTPRKVETPDKAVEAVSKCFGNAFSLVMNTQQIGLQDAFKQIVAAVRAADAKESHEQPK